MQEPLETNGSCLCWRLSIFPGRRQPSIFDTMQLNFRVRNGNGCTLHVIDTNYVCQRLPIFPGRRQPSIFGTIQLNFRVRNGNGCTLYVIGTDFWCTFRDSNPGPTD